MVQIVENWALIIGTVLGFVAGGDSGGGLSVRIDRIDPVPGFPMLLTQQPGDVVTIKVRPGQCSESTCPAGKSITIRVRRGRDPESLFADPQWSAAEAGQGTSGSP